jgi:predicted O-methyltransferase YrrM
MGLQAMAPALSGRRISTELAARWRHFRIQLARRIACSRRLGLIQGLRTSRIGTYTTLDELCALYDLARSCPPNSAALEIGSYLGASTCFLAKGLGRNGGRLYCVDTWNNETMPGGGRDTFAEFVRNTRNLAGTLRAVRKRSSELSVGDISQPIALAFLDGDHSYEATRADFERVAPWIDHGGRVAFHDCSHFFPGVTRVVGRALESGQWKLGGFRDSLCWVQKL